MGQTLTIFHPPEGMSASGSPAGRALNVDRSGAKDFSTDSPDREPPAMELPGPLLGRVINRYRFDELIGRGGFGDVYRAQDLYLHRDVAIKVSAQKLGGDSGKLEQLLNEARVQARLEHINIVPIHDVFEDSKNLFIVMRLLRGETLDQKVSRLGQPLPPLEAVRYFRQVLAGVDYAHSKGVVHQDLKPGNVLVTPTGEALILDFGVARFLEDKVGDPARQVGSPAYMAPEQISQSYSDARIDIYALGMTLYKVLTGRHPFAEATEVSQLLRSQIDRKPTPPVAVNSEIPAKLSDAIMGAISKDPRQRFRSCRDFATALDKALEDEQARSAEPTDGRWDPRIKVNFNARVKVAGSDIAFAARTLDLAVGGVRLSIRGTLLV